MGGTNRAYSMLTSSKRDVSIAVDFNRKTQDNHLPIARRIAIRCGRRRFRPFQMRSTAYSRSRLVVVMFDNLSTHRLR
jgi:hypothetical protein